MNSTRDSHYEAQGIWKHRSSSFANAGESYPSSKLNFLQRLYDADHKSMARAMNRIIDALVSALAELFTERLTAALASFTVNLEPGLLPQLNYSLPSPGI